MLKSRISGISPDEGKDLLPCHFLAQFSILCVYQSCRLVRVQFHGQMKKFLLLACWGLPLVLLTVTSTFVKPFDSKCPCYNALDN